MKSLSRFVILLFLSGTFFSLPAQIDCDKLGEDLQKIEQKLQKINTVDPDLIPLHYFFVLDIERELQHIRQNDIPHLQTCTELDFHETIEWFDNLSFKTKNFKTVLADQKQRVDILYYREAERMLLFGHRDSAWYDLERALQYNPVQPDALIMKARLELGEEQYESCVATIHILYNDATLTREHEIATSDLTQELYNALYHQGDSLLQNGHEAEALDVFRILETFCHNMPSSYCNDDYYKGIIRSQAGVYQSFLKIAEVARQRGNEEIAQSFLEYARQYREENGIPDDDPADGHAAKAENLEDVQLLNVKSDSIRNSMEPTENTPLQLLPPITTETDNEPATLTSSSANSASPVNEAPVSDDIQEALPHQPSFTPRDEFDPTDCESLLRETIELLLKGEYAQVTALLEMARTLPNCQEISIELLLEILQNRK